MYEENEMSTSAASEDYDEELALEFDATHDPEAVWEWNGDSWIAVNA
jgi:hypothetical protein